MKRTHRSLLRWSSGLAVVALAVSPGLRAQTVAAGTQLIPLAYQLIDPAPLVSLAPGRDARWRIETAAGLGERSQLRLSTGTFPQLSAPGVGQPLGVRATWRYTVYEQQSWAWRLGLTSTFAEQTGQGLAPPPGRTRFGALPLLHVAGEGSVAKRWLLGVEADGLLTPRGQRLELGLRVSYQLAPNFALVGGYRLSEGSGDGEDLINGAGIANSANVGLRLRF